MFLNPALGAALDRIAERAADVRRAFVPGALPASDDVAASAPAPQFTLDSLSVAAPPEAYFIVRTSDGTTGYTRDGAFHLTNGALCDEAGRSVVGMRAPGAAFDELRVDPVDAALGRVGGLRIGSDGTLSYARAAIDPRTGTRSVRRVVAGRLAIARFPAATKLETADGTLLRAPDGIVPHAGLPGDAGLPPLEPMRKTASGVDLDESLARLKAAYVAFDALAAAETAKGHFGKAAMDLVK